MMRREEVDWNAVAEMLEAASGVPSKACLRYAHTHDENRHEYLSVKLNKYGSFTIRVDHNGTEVSSTGIPFDGIEEASRAIARAARELDAILLGA